MNILKEEELPQPGHVLTIIEALNKSNFLQVRGFSTLPPLGSEKSIGLGTSLIHTRSTMSLTSSSYDESTFTDGAVDSIELEALYDHRYRPTCRSVPAKQSHVCDAKYVCVCNKKKCEFLQDHRHLTKSLNNLESSTSFQEPLPDKSTFRKYLTAARNFRSHSSNVIPHESKTLPTRKWKTPKSPIERFQICENLATQTTLQTTFKPSKRKYAFHTFKESFRRESHKGNGTASFLTPQTLNGIHSPNGNAADVPDADSSRSKSHEFKLWLADCCNCMPLTPLRIFFTIVGALLFLTGATYDSGLSHGVDSLFNSCWGWLRDEYQTFGENFLEYQKFVFKDKGTSSFYAEMNQPDRQPELPVNGKFIYILENTEFSVQMHFFSIKESSSSLRNNRVSVSDVGPLYFNIYFKSDKGFEVKYVASKSNITLSSTFEVFDVMKAILLSNQLPYFGFHIKDHYQTTPTAFLNVFIDSLNKFQIDTSFFSTLQAQIIRSANEIRVRRSSGVSGATTKRVRSTGVSGSTERRVRKSASDPGDIKESMKSMLNKFFLPLPLNILKPVNFPIPTINRNLTLKYKHPAMVSGLEGYQFVICDEISRKQKDKYGKVTDRSHVSNELVKTNVLKNKDVKPYKNPYPLYAKKETNDKSFTNFTVPSNVISLNPILLELIGKVFFLGKNLEVYPFWISSPHFVTNQESNPTSSYSNPIDGMDPHEDQHGSFVYYHPILGVPINASVAFQIGVYPPEGMLYAHKLVPVMWVRFQLDKMHPSLWYLFWGSFYIRIMLILTLIFTGLGIVLCALKCQCRCGKKCDEQMV